MLYPPGRAAVSLISLGCPADAGNVGELIMGQSVLDCIIVFLNISPLFNILSRGSVPSILWNACRASFAKFPAHFPASNTKAMS